MIMLDYILLGIIILIGLWGLKKGFLQALGSIVGLVLAVIIASRFYGVAASWFGSSNFSNILSFIIIFSLSSRIVGLIFWLLGKIFKIITILPLMTTLDRFLGLVLGLVEGILASAVILNFLLKYPLNYWMIEQMSASAVVKVLLNIGSIFVPLFPEALKTIKSFM